MESFLLMRTNQLQIMSCVNCEKIKTLRLPRKKHFEALSRKPIRNRLKSWWVWHTMSCHKLNSNIVYLCSIRMYFLKDAYAMQRLYRNSLSITLCHIKRPFQLRMARSEPPPKRMSAKRLICTERKRMVWCQRDWKMDTFQGCATVK